MKYSSHRNNGDLLLLNYSIHLFASYLTKYHIPVTILLEKKNLLTSSVLKCFWTNPTSDLKAPASPGLAATLKMPWKRPLCSSSRLSYCMRKRKSFIFSMLLRTNVNHKRQKVTIECVSTHVKRWVKKTLRSIVIDLEWLDISEFSCNVCWTTCKKNQILNAYWMILINIR